MTTLNNEIQNPLTTLLEKKYGINQSGKSNLKISDKDNLFTIFRKTAKYIYNNGEWSQEDVANAVKDYLNLSKMANVESVTPDTDQSGEKAIGSSVAGKNVYQLQIKNDQGKLVTEYMVLDPNNKDWAHQGDRWRQRSSNKIHWYTGNLNYTVGYGKLLHDLVKNYQQYYKTHPELSPNEFQDFLYRFVRHDYAGKKNDLFFQSSVIGQLSPHEFQKATIDADPMADELAGKHIRMLSDSYIKAHPKLVEKFGQDNIDSLAKRFISQSSYQRKRVNYLVLNYVKTYLQTTFNIVQQQHYEQQLQKKVHARAWEEKAQIKDSTRDIMQKSSLNQYFKGLELDNDVDIKQFNTFEREASLLMSRLPKFDLQPVLRLRKLGNYKAAGMYVPAVNTLIVDFRRPSEIYQNAVNRPANKDIAGYSSFIHEYGHYLDYHLNSDHTPLSVSSEFAKIQSQYADTLAKSNISNYSYYTTPTEVFARAFEIYCHQECGLRGNLNNCNLQGPEYEAFKDIHQDINHFFDSYSTFKDLRKSLNLDTSVAVPAVDERQNQAKLKQWDPLVDFSKEMLHKWTQTPDRLEGLIAATSNNLTINNPSRLIAYDQWNYHLPTLLSATELKSAGIPVEKLTASHIQGFAKVGDHWRSDRLFNAKEVKHEISKQQLQSIQPLLKNKITAEPAKIHSLAQSYCQTDQELTPIEKISQRMSQSMLFNAHVDPIKPFNFTPNEKELLSDLTPKQLSELYLTSVNQAKDIEPQLQRELAKVKDISKNISKPLIAANRLTISVNERKHKHGKQR